MTNNTKQTGAQRLSVPEHILARCPGDIPYMFPDNMLPGADCDNCIHMKLRAEDDEANHCYMFTEKPGDKCGQFKKQKGKESAII